MLVSLITSEEHAFTCHDREHNHRIFPHWCLLLVSFGDLIVLIQLQTNLRWFLGIILGFAHHHHRCRRRRHRYYYDYDCYYYDYDYYYLIS